MKHIPFKNDQEIINRINTGLSGLHQLLNAIDDVRANYIDDAEDDCMVEDATTTEPITHATMMGWAELDQALQAVESFRELEGIDLDVDFLELTSDDVVCGLACLIYVANRIDAPTDATA